MVASVYRLRDQGIRLPRPKEPVQGALAMAMETLGDRSWLKTQLLEGQRDLLPPLLNASVTRITRNGMVIQGIELSSRVQGSIKARVSQHRQTWWIAVVTEDLLASFDILPALKDGDSLCRRHMSVPGKDVQGCVGIPIMRNTTTTANPLPYSKVCDTSRPRIGQCATIRTDLGAERLVHFLIPRAMPKGLVREHRTKGRPACVRDAFRHAGPSEFGGRHVAHRDVVKLTHEPVRQLVLGVSACIHDTGVDLGGLSLLPGTLSVAQPFFELSKVPRVVNDLSGGERSKTLESQVDANTLERLSGFRRRLGDIDHDVQEPVASTVPGEIGAVLDLPFRQRPAVEDAKGVAGEAKRIAFALEVSPLERNPCERPLSSVTQEWALLSRPALGILLTHRVDGAGMQTKLLAAAGGELVQVETRVPAAPKTKRVFLPVVAIVPDEVDRFCLPVQQAVQRLHPVAVDQQHAVYFTSACATSPECLALALYLPALKGGVSRET